MKLAWRSALAFLCAQKTYFLQKNKACLISGLQMLGSYVRNVYGEQVTVHILLYCQSRNHEMAWFTNLVKPFINMKFTSLCSTENQMGWNSTRSM
jgi:hypothetical protein